MGRPITTSKFNVDTIVHYCNMDRDGPKNMVPTHHPGRESLTWKGLVPTQRDDRRKNKWLNDRDKD